MGPIHKITNYGTFLAPPGSNEVEVWREGSDPDLQQVETYHNPPFEQALTDEPFDCYLRRARHGSFGFQLRTDGSSILVSDVDDQVVPVCWLREGDEVTHINGQPVSSSLEATIRYLELAGDRVQLRVRKAPNPYHELNGSESGSRVVQHRVRQGDSVETIAKQYSTSTEQIRSDNRRHFPVGEPGFICPGHTLTIRRGIGTGRKYKGERYDTEDCPRRQLIIYDVQEGDSLESICSKFRVESIEIRRSNRSIFPVGESGQLVPGQNLTIFV